MTIPSLVTCNDSKKRQENRPLASFGHIPMVDIFRCFFSNLLMQQLHYVALSQKNTHS